MFSSRSFIVSGLTLRSLIHFEFIFVYGFRKCSSFILLQVVDQFSQHHLLKRLSLIYCIIFASFVKDKVSIGAWIYLWVFYFVLLDVRAIWLRHLSPHWSPGLIWLIWLARQVSPSSLTAPCASLPKLRARSKRMTIPERGGPVFSQGYMSSCARLLEPPNKLSRSTPAFLCEESFGQRSLVGYSPWGSQKVRHAWAPNTQWTLRVWKLYQS